MTLVPPSPRPALSARRRPARGGWCATGAQYLVARRSSVFEDCGVGLGDRILPSLGWNCGSGRTVALRTGPDEVAADGGGLRPRYSPRLGFPRRRWKGPRAERLPQNAWQSEERGMRRGPQAGSFASGTGEGRTGLPRRSGPHIKRGGPTSVRTEAWRAEDPPDGGSVRR
jgi:hypothetical protein